jgi:hypothetical protein
MGDKKERKKTEKFYKEAVNNSTNKLNLQECH